MIKIRKTIQINLPRGNRAYCPVYEHEGKYYIKANRPNTSSYSPFILDGIEYSEVGVLITPDGQSEFWYKK